MKELSIEEKAKAYDEALERYKAKQEYESKEVHKFIEYIFPEFAESEDEKIRKSIINLVIKSAQNGGMALHKWESQQMLAWLEKQGEQKPADVEEPDFFDDFRRTDSEVEPKFHEGDWVVINGFTILITDVRNDLYDVIFVDGGHRIYGIYDTNVLDKDAHLYTIQDAKDGDVLSDGTTIFIFKDLLSDGSVMSYCDYDTNSGESDAFCPLSMNLMCSKITPASKEQRDILMKAIADAGYTFDFEKKELKKIEQKPIDEVEPKFKVKYAGSEYNVFETKDIAGVTFYGIEDEPNHIDYVKAENCERVSGYVIKENGFPYPTKPAVFSEQTPAWSEEDEQYFNFLEKLLVILQAKSTENEIKKGTNSNSEYYYKVIQWFKSLKDRALTQLKLEWNEEDEDILNTIINHFEIDLECTKNDDIIKWLKSLRPQSQWKPSGEQIHAFEQVYDWYNNNFAPSETLTSLYSDLKKLKG